MSSTSDSNLTSSDKGLFPGYKHVEEFGPDDDYEDEVEECYVTLDLGSVDQTLVPSSSTYRLIGLDTPTPFLQLSGTIMKGHYQTLIGTELIFKDVSEQTDSPSQSNVLFFTKTDKRIQFREVELKPKTDEPSALASTRKKKYKFMTSSATNESLGAAPNAGDPKGMVSQDTEITGQSEETSMQNVDTETTDGHSEPVPTAGPSQGQSMDVDT